MASKKKRSKHKSGKKKSGKRKSGKKKSGKRRASAAAAYPALKRAAERAMGEAMGKITKKLAQSERAFGIAAGKLTAGMGKPRKAGKKRTSSPKTGKKRSKTKTKSVTANQIIGAARQANLKRWACQGIVRTGCGGSGSRVIAARGGFKRIRPVRPAKALAPCP